jgi:GT2 family glycosyltransferase
LAKARLTAEARAALAQFLASGARLVAPPCSGPPDVSVVVVVWNQPQLLLRCLLALVADAATRTEVVLVDNGSDAATQRLLSRLDGFVILSSRANEGFLRGCNRGAAAARGRHLVLLNSDAFVRPGALASALAVLDGDAGVGAVGGRLVLPNGRLQEAGCVVWSDGTTSGRRRGLPPDADAASRREVVDYCSGAFLMTPKNTWDRLGGFDEVFAPGYYEETDYCLRLAAAGLRVIYEPAVVVDHFEFGSQPGRGDAMRLSERNRVTFVARHADRLRDAPTRPAVGDASRAVDARGSSHPP